MSAFGHAGFGSSNRRNQLRAQGQIGGEDPYGNQVRKAMQPPTMAAYQAPAAYQQATGQQQATRQSQPAASAPPTPISPPTSGGSTPASGGSAQPQTGGVMPTYDEVMRQQSSPQTGGGFPVYGGSSSPQTGGVMPTYDEVMRQQSSPGSAQPIQPQSQGTPYGDSYSPTGGTNYPQPPSQPVTPGTAQPIPPPSQGTPYGSDNAPLTEGTQFVSRSLNRDKQYQTLDQRYAAQEEQRREAVAKQNSLDASRRDDMAEADRRRAEYDTRIQRERLESAERFAAQKPQMVKAIPGSANWSDDTWRFLMAGGTGRPSFPVWMDLTFPGKSREQIPHSDPALQMMFQRNTSFARGGALTTDNLYANPYQNYVNAVMATARN